MKKHSVYIKISEQEKESVFEKILKNLPFATSIFVAATFFMNYQISLQYEDFYEVPYEYFLLHDVYLNTLFTFLCMILIFISLFLFTLDINEFEKKEKWVKLTLIILIIVLIIFSLKISYVYTGVIIGYLILFIIVGLLIIFLFNKSNKYRAIIYTSAALIMIINFLNYLNPKYNDPTTKKEYEILDLKDNNHIETQLVKIGEKDGNFVVIDGKICKDNKTLKLKKGSYRLVDPTEFTITYKEFNKVDSLNQEEFDKNK
ncbi:hypothetical protein HMPREF3224_00702 [Anaerococcus hydrogenalis]|nr:hypothetical protein HMPREF3224_00702 [Anaerococcus hydrogenalis]